MNLLDTDRTIVSRSPFGSALRFLGPDGEFLGKGQPKPGPKGMHLHLFADSAGQEEVLTIHPTGVLNQAGPYCVVDSSTEEECATFHLNMLPQVSWQIADAEQQPLGSVAADYGDARTAVVQFDDQVACTVTRSARIFSAATWEVNFQKGAARPEQRRVLLAAVLILTLYAWPGGIISRNVMGMLSWILGLILCVAGVGTIVPLAVLSAIDGNSLPWQAYAVPGGVALIGLTMIVVRFKT